MITLKWFLIMSNKYVPSWKIGPPFISMSGYVLLGENKGKKLKDLSAETLEWYVNNLSLSSNEITEIKNELQIRQTQSTK